MKLVNLVDPNQEVSFLQAVRIGLGRKQGLFFPEQWPQLPVAELLKMPFIERSGHLLAALLDGELSLAETTAMVTNAFTFDAPVVAINERVSCLELFHGPTLAFKDFGARFMAQSLQKANAAVQQPHSTIVTATSGDTGAAVADAFFQQPGVRVVVLYPEGKVSPLQAQLFTTLGENVEAIAIKGDFDQCQALVKQVLSDQPLCDQLHVNSANSINISRLLAQVCYFFEAWAQLPAAQRERTSIVVPSGNFGNVCAALIAVKMGLPVRRVIAATNSNDTVPRYLTSGQWQPNPTQATLSNAMDISAPNNWPRVANLLENDAKLREKFTSIAVDETQTCDAVRAMYQQGYLSEPHAAVAWSAFERLAAADECGLIVGTAHPAKFADRVEAIIEAPVALPARLQEVLEQPSKITQMAADYAQLKNFLLRN
ncbi:threonine synthase [Pseudidiomarina sediminum]|uniref:threonine synthase n=1 Tax=Pseudidiomarina sediminum TaxID=431675 RepID=UPI001C9882A7|nr:threonine synthase [Pseudidiomarina sediminum]MBY6064128.1 threonine synthase [Pseudidiomarina sediminum]